MIGPRRDEHDQVHYSNKLTKTRNIIKINGQIHTKTIEGDDNYDHLHNKVDLLFINLLMNVVHAPQIT
jgi:hypothetical protein